MELRSAQQKESWMVMCLEALWGKLMVLMLARKMVFQLDYLME
jgi:hypothetical protein